MLVQHSKKLAFTASVALLLGGLARAADTEPGIHYNSLSHAVQALEQQTGGKVMEVRLADEKGEPSFEAAIAKEDGVIYMRISTVAAAGTVIEVKDLPEWLLNWTMTAFMKSIYEANIPLAQAIAKAEQIAKAPAIGAGLAAPLSGTNAVLAYNIEVMKGGTRMRMAIDAKTGQQIANPDALYEPWTPVKLARRLAP
jgi:uncharacterized membrane protein YkoI